MDKKKLLLGLIRTYQRRNDQSYNRILMIVMPLTLTSIAGFIYCLFAYLDKFDSYYYYYDSDSYKGGAFILGFTALTFFVMSCMFFSLKITKARRLKIFSKMNTKILVWRLENDQWTRLILIQNFKRKNFIFYFCYLDYIYGPNRPYERFTCLTWSCRRKKYNRLKDRKYGQIIFTVNGIIIDEFEIFVFKKKHLLASIKLVNYSNEQFMLHIYTLDLSLLTDKRVINDEDIEQKGLEIDIYLYQIYLINQLRD